ncbi:MAG: imidazole glycerol phosphate synthase subunit HisF [Endomicrobium sp.]|nr:imidazole glycerol phosphate synthase subunit HisF [Endomicrobium sp.]
MLKKRIIPCLDIANGKVVKGINFIDLVDVGDAVEVAKRYEQQCADEVVFLDITATYENRDTIYDLIKRAASELSIPLTVGGGIRAVDDFRKILSCGADKVAINSSAVANPNLIREVSEEFGRQCVNVAIDGKLLDGGYKVFVKGGRENAGLDLVEWAKKCEDLGAGEILLTSMDGDGTQNGYDIAMINAVCDRVNIPVIASGGCGSIDDIIDVFKNTNCDAALVASLFHYGMATVNDVKIQMERSGISCRILTV